MRGLNAQLPKGEKDVNKFLSNKGFSTMKVPGGFSPLAAYIGTATPANIDGTKVKSRAFSTAVRAIMPKRDVGSSLHECGRASLAFAVLECMMKSTPTSQSLSYC